MKSKYGIYVLMLCYVDENWMDIGGNIFPTEGFVETKNFKINLDIMTGLNGILWGKTSYLPYEKKNKGNWLVIKTEINSNLVKIDEYYNRYKFPNGTIVHSGDIRSAAKYIIKNKDDDYFNDFGKWVQPEEIAGSKEWMKEYQDIE